MNFKVPVAAFLASTALSAPAFAAVTPTTKQIEQTITITRRALAAAKRNDWKTACREYKNLTAYKTKVGGFNYTPVTGTGRLRTLQIEYNSKVTESNNLHNKNGASLCNKAGMTWAHVSMPAPPSTSSLNASVSSTIRAHCDNKWGTDYRMVKYCVDQQTKAYNSL